MKIAVIIPYREDRGFLKHAIDSVWRQTFRDFVLFTVNKPQCLSKNFNYGLGLANEHGCDFLKMLCDDDMLTDTALEDLYNGIYPSGDICISNAINFTELREDEVKSRYTGVKDLLADNTIHGGTCLYSVKKLNEVNGMREDLITGEEFDLNVRIMKSGGKIKYVDKITYKYRIHYKQKSLNHLDFESMVQRKEYIKNNIINAYI